MASPTRPQHPNVSDIRRGSAPSPSSSRSSSVFSNRSSVSSASSISRSSTPVHDSNGNLLPAILCLHGGGSTSTVFKIQCRRLVWNLHGQFRFVFAQAPIEGEPGSGMLPVFTSCAPFYRWVSRRFKVGDANIEAAPQDEVKVLDQIIEKVMEENGGIESFVGIMGFSQGARVVPGLLIRHRLQEQNKLGGSPYNFKFGVSIGGPYPPLSLHENPEVEDYEILKEIPSVHAWGRCDFVRKGCEQLWQVADGDMCFQMDFEGKHHLPLQNEEANDLCDLIRGAWYAAGGKMSIGGDETY